MNSSPFQLNWNIDMLLFQGNKNVNFGIDGPSMHLFCQRYSAFYLYISDVFCSSSSILLWGTELWAPYIYFPFGMQVISPRKTKAAAKCLWNGLPSPWKRWSNGRTAARFSLWLYATATAKASASASTSRSAYKFGSKPTERQLIKLIWTLQSS